MVERRPDVQSAKLSQARAGEAVGGNGGEALLHVTVDLDMKSREALEQGPLPGGQVAQGNQMLGQRSRLIALPGARRLGELSLFDQAVMDSQ